MKNIQNLIKNKPVEYVEGMNHLYSNGPKPKGDTIQQLLDLKEWSQNPERYERRLNFRAGQAKKKEQAEALKNSKKWIDNPKKLEAFIKSEDPVLRNAKEKKQIKVVKKPLPKDWQPKYLNGNVIDITPLLDDQWWEILGKESYPWDDTPDDTRNRPTLEEAIELIAYQRELAENKLSGLNEEFVKQKLRERMS